MIIIFIVKFMLTKFCFIFVITLRFPFILIFNYFGKTDI